MAPDDASKKAGIGLANLSKWVSNGANEKAVWGECQGSGSKPYLAQVDLGTLAFKCSCPSRKFPCKHGLGLLLLYARQASSFTETAAPDWVSEWLNKRSEKQEKQAAKKDTPVDEAAQTKRQQARQLKVNDGIGELLTWMKDILRNGLMSVPEKSPALFDNMSRRLVDAQAPGLAGMVRMLGETNFYQENWPGQFLSQLASVYLVIKGYMQESLSDTSLEEDCRSWIGFTQNQDELKEKNGVMDTWMVLGKQSNENDSVTTEKYWLQGAATGKTALIMQFIIRGQGVQYNLTPGMFIQAELVFFPSALPLRALIKRQLQVEAVPHFSFIQDWQEVAGLETQFNSLLPFRSERPYLMQDLKPVLYNKQWWLQDKQQALMPLRKNESGLWKLLALSGGQALNMAVIGKENSYEPLGVWQHKEYITL